MSQKCKTASWMQWRILSCFSDFCFSFNLSNVIFISPRLRRVAAVFFSPKRRSYKLRLVFKIPPQMLVRPTI